MSTKAKKSKSGQLIALTGGTGFLGSHVIDSLVAANYKVRALTRRPQKERDSVEWVEGSLENSESLERLCAGADALINVAGLTKAINRDAFFDVNVRDTKNVFDAAAAQKIKQVVHISSLAAREPRLSHYGASKAGSEMLLTARKWPFSWSIVRPPAIYGPGDKEILKLLKATKFGILPAPGSVKNRFSMIHAKDLANALVAMLEIPSNASIVEIDDKKAGGYQLHDIAAVLSDNTGKNTKTFSLPFWAIGTVGAVNGMIASALNKPAMLTLSTARYLCHPDWTVREGRRPSLANWSPQFDLKSGLEDTISWYKKNGLL